VVSDVLEADLYDAAESAAPAEWSKFVQTASLLAVWRWPVVHASAGGAAGSCLGAVIRDGSTTVALAMVRIRRLGPMLIADVEAPGTSALPGLAWPAAVDAPLGSTPIDVTFVANVIKAVESALRARFGPRLRLIALRQVFANLMPAVLTSTSLTYEGTPVSYLHNRYDSFTEFLRTLGRSRRNDQARLLRRHDEDPTLTISVGPVPTGWDAAPFYQQSDDTSRRNHRQRFPPMRLQPRAVRDALVFGEDARLMRYEEGGRLIGCGLIFDHSAAPLSSAWGARHPSEGGRTGLWFDYMARAARWAIESERCGFIAGKGLTATKAELGYSSVRQWTVVRPLSR
jgi:hypothetical protein